MAFPKNRELDAMDVHGPLDADGMDDAEQDDDREGEEEESYEDGGSMSAQMHQFLTEMDLDLAQRKQALKSLIKGGGMRQGRGGGGLPQHLKAAMGQANLRVARGDLEEAIKICMEVVRQAPDVPEPFVTLEMIYEEMGDEEKRFQFALIAAHLQPRDSQQWIKTAELAEQRGDLRVAVKCYTKAISLIPSNTSLLWKKASLLHMLADDNKSLETYQKLLDLLPSSSGMDHVAVAMEMAKIHHENQKTVEGIKVLKSAYHRHFACFTEEAVNMLAELYMVTKDYWGALETILKYCNIPLSREVAERGREGILSGLESLVTPAPPFGSLNPTPSSALPTSLSEAIGRSLNLVQPIDVAEALLDGAKKEEDPVIKFVEELVVPGEVPLDLKTKIAVCLIHLYSTAPQYLLYSLYELDAEDYGDIFLDIAEAFMDSELYARAQPLLSILVETQNYSQAGVWLRHAECLHSLNQLESAAVSYAQVVALAPHHTNAKLTLATIYGQLGRTDDALAVLDERRMIHTHNTPTKTGGDGAVGDAWTEEAPLVHLPLMAKPDQLPPSIQDLRVSYHRFELLFYEERLPECCDLALEMLYFLFRDYIYQPSLKAMAHLTFKSVKKKVTEVEYHSEELKKELQQKEKKLSWEEWWNVMKKGCQALWMLGRRDELCRVVFAANVSNWFGGITKEMDYELAALSFSACVLSGDWKQAVLFLRSLVSSDWPHSGSPKLHALWNYFNLGPLNLSIAKFLLRLLIKDQGSLPVLKMSANYYFCSGSLRTSLNMYHAVLRQDPTDYLAYFCMGLSFLTMAQQRGKVVQLRRSTLIAQGFGFLCHYAKLRGQCQETLYNLGRAFHQIGYVNYASHFYKLVLSAPPELVDDPTSDLKQEAAYNLSLIYKASQNKALARHVLWTYIHV